jgi:hypothetical protein
MASAAALTISVAEIQPGMVLAEAAQDARGRLLAPAGMILTRRHQRQMRQWGVAVVAIHAASAPERAIDPVVPTSLTVHELVQIDERDPFMRELAQMARDRYARHQQQAARANKEGSRV